MKSVIEGTVARTADRRSPQVLARLREHVRQAHELDDLQEGDGRVPQPHLAPEPARGKLKAGERVHRHGVGGDAGDVTRDDIATRAKQRTHAVAQTGKVGAGDRAADGEGDLVRPGCRHRG